MDRVSKTAIVIALLLTLLIGFGYSRVRHFDQRQREIDRFRKTIEDARGEVEQKEREAAEKEAELKAVDSDPAAREASARQGLRWVREGEKVYIVEEPWEVVPVGNAPGERSEMSGAQDGITTRPSNSAGSVACKPPSVADLAPLAPPEGEDSPASAGHR